MRELGLMLALAASTAFAQESTLAPIVVTATRSDQQSIDLPLSIDQLNRDSIRQDRPMVNLSESLARIPGLVAQDRQNYAQDLQISSRGFGARSTFGVRGIRLFVDGIPATMPDGQGQISHIDLASADRIEIMRGPFSALYGNSSGGVIAVFSENGKPGTTLQTDLSAGSFDAWRLGLKATGQQGDMNYLASASRFATDGYREHSAAARDTQNAKLRLALDNDSILTLIGNGVQMHDAQDPLGLTRTQFETDPRSADPSALQFNTRKSVEQYQLGLRYERFLSGQDNLQAALYTGNRDTTQFQAIPAGAQTPPTHAGGVIDLGRQYWGGDFRWTRKTTLANQALEWTAGLSYDRLDEDRRGHENFSGGTLGVIGQLRRDEANRIASFDQYLQAQWHWQERWLWMAGVRNSRVQVHSDDHFIVAGNGDDSGGTIYRATSPVVGVTYKSSDVVHLYASYGKGFETPTFNELSYRSTNGTTTGLNFDLQPARSDNIEIGLKAAKASALFTAALFHTDTRNELTVLANSGGRTVYQNAGKTRRDGIELRLVQDWRNGFRVESAYSWLRAAYAEAFCNGACTSTTRVNAGNYLPGVPMQNWFGEISWKHPRWGFHTALEARYTGKVFVDDPNSDAAPSYTVLNWRAGFEQKISRWEVKEFVRIDNLTDRRYAGSVIVNESNRRYFEPAPSRNFLIGASAAYRW